MDKIVNWIETIIAVMLFTILIELIIPDGKTKKYVQLVISLLITVVILNPIISMVQGNTDFSSLIAKNTSYINFKDIEANTRLINEKQDNLIFESYKENMEQDIIKEIKRNKYDVIHIDIQINKDEKNFGLISKLNLQLNKNDEVDKRVMPIKKVSLNDSKCIENQEIYQKDIILITDILCEKYNIDKNNIQISIINL